MLSSVLHITMWKYVFLQIIFFSFGEHICQLSVWSAVWLVCMRWSVRHDEKFFSNRFRTAYATTGDIIFFSPSLSLYPAISSPFSAPFNCFRSRFRHHHIAHLDRPDKKLQWTLFLFCFLGEAHSCFFFLRHPTIDGKVFPFNLSCGGEGKCEECLLKKAYK